MMIGGASVMCRRPFSSLFSGRASYSRCSVVGSNSDAWPMSSARCRIALVRAVAAGGRRYVVTVLEPAKRVGAHRFDEQGFRFDDRPDRLVIGERNVLRTDAEDNLAAFGKWGAKGIAVERDRIGFDP